MPKRLIDGEAFWLSEKVKLLPKEYRLHYAAWIPLAEANGVFEASVSQIYTRVYSFLRPDFGPKQVSSLLAAFVRVGLIKLFKADGKTWGFFIGMDKEGRLPSISHLNRYKNLPPNPPIEDESYSPQDKSCKGED